MQAEQIRQLRRRKFELYASLLPRNSLHYATTDLGSDADYATALLDVERVAPSGFGLTVGHHRRLADLGILGHVTMSCATIGEVFELWMIYADNAGELVQFSAATGGCEENRTWSILIRPRAHLPQPVADMLVDELCAAFFVYAQEITGHPFNDFSVELSHPRSDAVDYVAAFPGAVSFSASVASVTGPASALGRLVQPLDQQALGNLVDQFGGDRAELQHLQPTTLQLYDLLAKRRGASPTLGEVATALRLSSRTLVRRLANENTSYGTVLDEFRCRYALALAQYGGLRAKQIAHLVGFRSENSLRKAFKKWTGKPVGAWIGSLEQVRAPHPLDRTGRSDETRIK